MLTGLFETALLIMHTPIDDGQIKVWHSLIVKSPTGAVPTTSDDLVAAKQYQEMSRLAFAQDFEVWTNKGPCLNGLFIPSDGPFLKCRVWYKQFYNPRAKKQEYLDQCEGMYRVRGVPAYTAA